MAEQFQTLVTISRTGTTDVTISLNAQNGDLILGGHGQDGDIVLRSSTGTNRIRLDGNGANGWFGGHGEEGDIVLFPASGNNSSTSQATIHLNGGTGNIRLGGAGQDGDLTLQYPNGQNSIRLDGNGANGWFGGNGEEGDIVLFPASGNNSSTSQATVHINGGTGNIRLGGAGQDGDLTLQYPNGQNSIRLDGNGANGWFGGNGEEGNILLFPASGNNTSSSQASIHLDGGSGDIILRNADFAEDFDIAPAVITKIEPGTVMVMNEIGDLVECEAAYDKRVAGVISGAGKYKPGIIMDKQDDDEFRMPVSLTGKVMCKVDASYGAIMPGDLLTTSPTTGHAMKATDQLQSVGSVIGKALKPLKEGCSMLPILVTLH